MDFFRGKGGAEQVFSEATAGVDIVSSDGFVPGIQGKTAVFPSKHLIGFGRGEEFFPDERFQEAVAEKLSEGNDAFLLHHVKSVSRFDPAGGAEDVEMGMKAQVITKGLHSGDGGELSVRQVEAGAHPVVEGVDGDLKKEAEKFAAFLEDAAKGFGNGEDKLAARDTETGTNGDPLGGLEPYFKVFR